MKYFEIYGVKRRFLIFFFGFVFALIGTAALLTGAIVFRLPFVYFFAFLLFAYGGFLLYEALRVLRPYKTLKDVSGIDMDAVLTHFDEKGQISMFALMEASIGGKIVEGRLYASFDEFFRKNYEDGDTLHVRYLATGEFLLYETQRKNVK